MSVFLLCLFGLIVTIFNLGIDETRYKRQISARQEEPIRTQNPKIRFLCSDGFFLSSGI